MMVHHSFFAIRSRSSISSLAPKTRESGGTVARQHGSEHRVHWPAAAEAEVGGL